MHKIKLDSIFINDRDQNEKLFINKSGQNYKMCNIQWEGKKASMYLGDNPYGKKDLEILRTWTSGDTVEVILEKNGEYLNFKVPSRVDQLEARIKVLENHCFNEKTESQAQEGKDIHEEMSNNSEDLPF